MGDMTQLGLPLEAFISKLGGTAGDSYLFQTGDWGHHPPRNSASILFPLSKLRESGWWIEWKQIHSN
jgi:hypothetical protein